MSAKKQKNFKRLRKDEYERLAAFRSALRRFLSFSEAAAESVGLTPQQHQALLAIKGVPARDHLTNGELAESLQIKHHSAVGLINRLEAQGLIVRERGRVDRRQVYLMLTPRGEELLEQLTVAHQEELKQIAPQLQSILDDLNGQ